MSNILAALGLSQMNQLEKIHQSEKMDFLKTIISI